MRSHFADPATGTRVRLRVPAGREDLPGGADPGTAGAPGRRAAASRNSPTPPISGNSRRARSHSPRHRETHGRGCQGGGAHGLQGRPVPAGGAAAPGPVPGIPAGGQPGAAGHPAGALPDHPLRPDRRGPGRRGPGPEGGDPRPAGGDPAAARPGGRGGSGRLWRPASGSWMRKSRRCRDEQRVAGESSGSGQRASCRRAIARTALAAERDEAARLLDGLQQRTPEMDIKRTALEQARRADRVQPAAQRLKEAEEALARLQQEEEPPWSWPRPAGTGPVRRPLRPWSRRKARNPGGRNCAAPSPGSRSWNPSSNSWRTAGTRCAPPCTNGWTWRRRSSGARDGMRGPAKPSWPPSGPATWRPRRKPPRWSTWNTSSIWTASSAPSGRKWTASSPRPAPPKNSTAPPKPPAGRARKPWSRPASSCSSSSNAGTRARPPCWPAAWQPDAPCPVCGSTEHPHPASVAGNLPSETELKAGPGSGPVRRSYLAPGRPTWPARRPRPSKGCACASRPCGKPWATGPTNPMELIAARETEHRRGLEVVPAGRQGAGAASRRRSRPRKTSEAKAEPRWRSCRSGRPAAQDREATARGAVQVLEANLLEDLRVPGMLSTQIERASQNLTDLEQELQEARSGREACATLCQEARANLEAHRQRHRPGRSPGGNVPHGPRARPSRRPASGSGGTSNGPAFPGRTRRRLDQEIQRPRRSPRRRPGPPSAGPGPGGRAIPRPIWPPSRPPSTRAMARVQGRGRAPGQDPRGPGGLQRDPGPPWSASRQRPWTRSTATPSWAAWPRSPGARRGPRSPSSASSREPSWTRCWPRPPSACCG